MAAPRLDSDHPGLRLLAEVASIFAAGFASEDALTQVVGALRRGLALRRCRLWLRDAAGGGYTPLTTPGDEAVLPAFAAPVADWIAQGARSERGSAGMVLLRLPLVHQEEALGMIEALIPEGRFQGMAHDVLVVVAQILAPVIAATELSQDVARDDAVGREVFEVLDRQPRDLLKREFDRVFDTGEMQQMEMESRATGDIRHYRITKIPMRQDGADITHVITIGEDITEWREAQQRLAETEKLAAVGQLAAGVMHEINNPLATILACSEALALRNEDLAPPERQAHQEYLKIVDAEVQRCRRIVDSLLDFSRSRSGDKRQVDVNAVVEQTLFLLKHHARFKRLTVTRELAPGLPAVLADQEKLIQSFMALMLNAMDAMDSRGTLTVRSGINPERRDEVLLEFVDTGVGIKQEDLPKIFEPFFTTKPQGRGTGLGLSICYGIIAEHRGRIEVESQVGVGSNFKVYLPVG